MILNTDEKLCASLEGELRKLWQSSSRPAASVTLYDSAPSTMDAVREASSAIRPAGFFLEQSGGSAIHDLRIALAREQLRGRGREGRGWISAKDHGAFITAGFSIRKSVQELMGISLVIGAEIVQRLRASYSLHSNTEIGLKWPNDIFVLRPGRSVYKLGGILIETESRGANETRLSAGVGLNLRRQEWPAELAAISLDEIILAPPDLSSAAALLVDSLVEAGESFLERGLADVRAEWEALSLFYEQPMSLRLPKETVEGKEAGIGADGSLRLRGSDGTERNWYFGELQYSPG